MSPVVYHTVMTHCARQLLDLSPIGVSKFTDSVAQLLHLSLLAFMTSMLMFIGYGHYQRHELLLQRAMAAVDDVMMDGASIDEKIDLKVLNWALHVLLLSVAEESMHPWLAPKLTYTRARLRLTSLDGVLHSLHQFPWVSVLHDNMLRSVLQTSSEVSMLL